MNVVALSLPKMLDATQVKLTAKVSLSKNSMIDRWELRTVIILSFSCNPYTRASSGGINSKVNELNIKEKSGNGSGSLLREHSRLKSGSTESILSRQKSVPTV